MPYEPPLIRPPAPTTDDLQESAEARYRRSPGDLLRLIGALLAAIVGFLLASVLDNLNAALAIETIEIFDVLPDGVVVAMILVVQLLAWLVPPTVAGALVWQRRYRRFGLMVFAAAVAVLAAWALNRNLISRFQPPALPVDLPGWICRASERATGFPELSTVTRADDAAGAIFGSTACVPGDAFPGTVYLAGFAAGLGALTPWLVRRWQRAAWVALVLFLLVRTLDGVVVPVDALFMLAVGYAVGAGTDLIFGSPRRHPTRQEVFEALASRGLRITSLAPANVTARSSVPYRAVSDDGRRLFVKLLGPDERAADLLFRAYRVIRFRGFGDERPAPSLRRAVEHEAVMAVSARIEGVRTPEFVAIADVGRNSMVLAFEDVDGSVMTDAGAISDEVQREMWRQVALLRSHRIAHRNLGLHNAILDSAGRPWLLNFGDAVLGAHAGQLRNDVAQLLVAVAVRVGPASAVANAIAVLGVDVVQQAASRLQDFALGSTLRDQAKAVPSLMDDLRAEVKTATGLETIDFEPLQRVKPSSVLTVVMLGLAFYLLLPQLASVDLSDIAEADWTLLPLIVGFSFATYVAAAVALMGAVPDRLRFTEMLLAQMASSFFNRIVPAKVGGMAANVRFLQKRGVAAPVAVASVGVNNLAGVVVHVTLTAVFVMTAGRGAGASISLPSGQTTVFVLVGVLTLAGSIMVVPRGRAFFLARVWPILRKAGSGIATVVESPLRMTMLFGGAALIIISYIMSLWYSVEAFGGGIGFVSVALVFLAGTAVAQAAPTPGGIGAAEAAMIAGFTAFGLSAAVAVPGVFLYRLATFWLPVLPGWLAYRLLAARGAF